MKRSIGRLLVAWQAGEPAWLEEQLREIRRGLALASGLTEFQDEYRQILWMSIGRIRDYLDSAPAATRRDRDELAVCYRLLRHAWTQYPAGLNESHRRCQ